jgi:hypothetical protein
MTKQELLAFITIHESNYTLELKKQHPTIFEEIDNKYTFDKFSQKMYHYINEDANGKCKECGALCRFDGITKGYRTFCSSACLGKNRHKISNASEVRICVICKSEFEIYKKREKTTCSSKCLSILNTSPEVNKKRTDSLRKSMMEKYGVDHNSKLPDFGEKMKSTKLKKYGDENYVNPDKAKETKLNRYGDSAYNNLEKMKNTCQEKYGVDNFSQTENFRKSHFNHTISKFDNITPMFTIDTYSGASNKKYEFKCNTCNFQFIDSCDNGKIPVCPICYPNRITINYGHPKTVDITCKNCNEIFNVEWEFRNRIFCSVNCKCESDTKEHHEKVNCLTCGTLFDRYKNIKHPRSGKLKQYCSNECSVKSIEKKRQLRDWIKNNNPMDNQLSIDKISQTKLDRYGDKYYNNPEKNKETMMLKYGVPYAFYLPSCKSNGIRISKFQRKVFDSILVEFSDAKLEEYLPDVQKCVDIYIPSIKKVIECHGDYWHCNPECFLPIYYNESTHLTAQEMWDKDNKKKKILEDAGYIVEIIWENVHKKLKPIERS